MASIYIGVGIGVIVAVGAVIAVRYVIRERRRRREIADALTRLRPPRRFESH